MMQDGRRRRVEETEEKPSKICVVGRTVYSRVVVVGRIFWLLLGVKIHGGEPFDSPLDLTHSTFWKSSDRPTDDENACDRDVTKNHLLGGRRAPSTKIPSVRTYKQY
jgi:hypothetical protein